MLTPLGNDGGISHRLRPDELEVVRRTLIHTTIPSWIDRVPHKLGSASHGSLMASEWLILYKVYYMIALVPVWKKAYSECATPEEKERVSKLLESTTLLSRIAHFLTLPKINPKDLPELDDMIMKYRTCLKEGWPGASAKPNLHLTQHYSDVIRRFGPPRSTAAWAQERVNGMLQRLRTNHHPCKSVLVCLWYGLLLTDQFLVGRTAEIPKTLLKKWHINSTLQLITPTADTTLLEKDKKHLDLDDQMMKKWKRAIAGKETSRGRLGDNLQLDSKVSTVKMITIKNKPFSTANHHLGNSYVEFLFGTDQRFGSISSIFCSSQTHGKIWIIINPLKELDKSDDPYDEYPDLNCRLVHDEFEAAVIVEQERIIGHVAVLKNPGGTFGIEGRTITAVGLGTVVSLCSVVEYVAIG